MSIMKRTIILCCKEFYNDAERFDTGDRGIQNSETNLLYNFWSTITGIFVDFTQKENAWTEYRKCI